jgi:hypothetical protein
LCDHSPFLVDKLRETQDISFPSGNLVIIRRLLMSVRRKTVKLVEGAFPLFQALKVSTRQVLFFAKAGQDVRNSKGKEILVDLTAITEI